MPPRRRPRSAPRACFAASTTVAIARSTRGSWARAACGENRSALRIECVRSLVPMLRKSTSAAISPTASTPAEVSIIAPIWGGRRPEPTSTASSIACRARSTCVDARRPSAAGREAPSSRRVATIARSWAAKVVGVAEQQLDSTLLDPGQEGRRLVAAEVEHPDRRRPPVQLLEDRRQSASVLVLARPVGRRPGKRAPCEAGRRPRRRPPAPRSARRPPRRSPARAPNGRRW